MDRIGYYDLDCFGRLKFSALLRRAHEAADTNATALGIGYAQLAPLGMSFVLQRFSAAAARLPAYGEEVDIRTWPAAIERGLFIRKGAMRTPAGETLIEWASLWLLFDLNARRILKPAALPVETSALLEGDRGVATGPEKVPVAADFTAWGAAHTAHTHTVRFADVDTNRHMNNAIYGDVVANAAFENDVRSCQNSPPPWARLDINYLAEARPGEEIAVTARRDGQGEILIMGEAGRESTRRIFTARVQ